MIFGLPAFELHALEVPLLHGLLLIISQLRTMHRQLLTAFLLPSMACSKTRSQTLLMMHQILESGIRYMTSTICSMRVPPISPTPTMNRCSALVPERKNAS